MKTLKTLLKTGLLALAIAFSSCSSDDGGNGGGGSGFYLTAKVDGGNYKSYVKPMAVMAGGMLMIQSSTSAGDAIQIQVANYNGVGTYTSGNNNLTNGYINYLDMGSQVGQFVTYTSVRGTGTVEITEVTDTAVMGTFTATAVENQDGATNDVSITNGKFRAEIQQ